MYYWLITNDTTGAIGTGSSTHLPDNSLALSGFSFLGPYDDSGNKMDSATQTVFDTPQAWLYQGGNFVANPSYNANAIALANAKTVQTAAINSAYASAMAAGFASSADGTARTYDASPESLQELGWVRPVPQASYPTTGLPAKLIDGTHIPLSYAQMQQLISDGQTFFMVNKGKKVGYLNAIISASTVAEVQSATW